MDEMISGVGAGDVPGQQAMVVDVCRVVRQRWKGDDPLRRGVKSQATITDYLLD